MELLHLILTCPMHPADPWTLKANAKHVYFCRQDLLVKSGLARRFWAKAAKVPKAARLTSQHIVLTSSPVLLHPTMLSLFVSGVKSKSNHRELISACRYNQADALMSLDSQTADSPPRLVTSSGSGS